MRSIRNLWRHRSGATRPLRGGLFATLVQLDDDPVLFCECGAGGDCGEEHAVVPA